MDLTHRFTVPATVEETWAAFNDIESVAECFPGATVTSVEGDEFKGTCKVKLGPISLVYTGTGKFLEKDESAHRFVIEAKGKDKRGNGTAGATVTAALTAAAEGSTDVEVKTDLSITGKPAQFGRGVIQDVSDKLLQQFVTCLESKVGGTDGSGEAAGKHAADLGGATARKAPATTYAGVSAGADPLGESVGEASSTGLGAARQGADDALDLGATVLPILLRSYWKPIVGGLAGLWLVRKLFRRR